MRRKQMDYTVSLIYRFKIFVYQTNKFGTCIKTDISLSIKFTIKENKHI